MGAGCFLKTDITLLMHPTSVAHFADYGDELESHHPEQTRQKQFDAAKLP
jgi:hypothetical protein